MHTYASKANKPRQVFLQEQAGDQQEFNRHELVSNKVLAVVPSWLVEAEE